MSARSEFDALKQSMAGLANQGYVTNKNNVDMSEYEEFIPPSNIQFGSMPEANETYNNASSFSNGPNYEYEEPSIPKFTGYQDEEEIEQINENDERLWPGGPLSSEVESWKKQYNDIYMADDIDSNQIFIFRTISRYEYKAIVAAPNTDPLMREEMICEQCVLYPYEYSYGVMSNGNAGNVTTLAEQILMTSGFTKASVPRKL